MSSNELNAVNLELNALLDISPENRKGAWSHRLAFCLPRATFTSGEPDIIFNPQGLTYYNLKLLEGSSVSEDAKRYQLPELIDGFLIHEGVGIAIESSNPKRTIDLSYGDILGFHLHRSFDEPVEHLFKTDKPRASIIDKGVDVILSDVSPEVLPATVNTLLKAIMTHIGIKQPEIKMMYLPAMEQYELIFGIDNSQLSTEKRHHFIQKLGWFLPRYYAFTACDLSQIEQIQIS